MEFKSATRWIAITFLISIHSAFAVGNGEVVSSSDWLAKHVIALHYRNGSINKMCTGTVLGPRHILTAAHCFVSAATGILLPKEKFEVLLSLDVSASMLGIENESVAKIGLSGYTIFSPVVKLGTPGDIAVVKLRSDLPKQYSIVRLEKETFPISGDLIIAGYGITAPSSTILRGTHLTRGTLYQSPIPENDTADFFNAINTPYFIHMNSRLDNSVCSGDSGGPIFRSDGRGWVQVGIAHGSTNRDGVHLGKCPNEESYATTVAPYFQWVQSVIENL